MPYSEMMVAPMREEVTRLGVQELRTVVDVDAALAPGEGTVLVFVNSICGCAAGMARPALTQALRHPVRPRHLYTVFAGQDLEAAARARSYLADFQPSSPSVALLRDGEVVHFVHRHMIEGRSPDTIAAGLIAAFEKFCSSQEVASSE
ncbi:MAG TPA: BrxA/BrxB family bacilliredoxin [Gemmatimonadales bacterium]|jgi:putative YphP/YqiW family bacilliredoxin|nr:BrxA/BrxB family bacilliredoxin [Gemmatimonadales bacterium]